MSAGIIDELKWRGLISQTSDEESLTRHLQGSSRTLYCGFDPTADSLHVGSLVPLMCLRRFQLFGHRPIALVGGATGLIGDPSFKSSERSLNSADVVASWVEKLESQVARFLDLSGNNGAIVVDNLSWTKQLDVIEFLRDVGKHFSVNAMIQKDAVRSRLAREGTGISFTEFSYIILQSLDYLELAKRYGCTLQVGGSDQWGNITGGMDLVRRVLAREVHAMTFPLITQNDGTKFGKTESGTIWLDADKTSAYAFYQFWLNTADADAGRFLRWFTFLDETETAELELELARSPQDRLAQKRLATEVTRFVHGEEGLQSAERITRALFGGDVRALRAEELEQLSKEGMPTIHVDEDELPLAVALARVGGADSRGAARRLIQGGGISVNGEQITSVDCTLDRSLALFGRYQLVRKGKKNWHLIVHRNFSDGAA
jgi:tyrosyl-tRNA synthetase